jgi:hypothetical protein
MSAQLGSAPPALRSRARRRLLKALRVFVGTLLMAAVALGLFAAVFRYAGGWGVPYFGFTSERGSPCRNTLTGYTCSPLTLADVEFYTDLDLPDDTQVANATYTATHDYRLQARLIVPQASAKAATEALREAYGRCHKGVPPMDTRGMSRVCVMSNDDAVVRSGEPSSQIYAVATGRTEDGSLQVGMAIRSR